MTQGALGHTGAQGRAKGFKSVVEQVSRTSRCSTSSRPTGTSPRSPASGKRCSPSIRRSTAAFFHNDDMALAAYNVMKAKGRDRHPDRRRRRHAAGDRGGARRPHVRHRAQPVLPHPWRRDRRPASRRSWAARRPASGIPKNIVTDGPVVTKENAPGMLWMQKTLPDLIGRTLADGSRHGRGSQSLGRSAAWRDAAPRDERHLEVVRRRRRRCATSTSRCAPARSTAWSARTAPASRR